MYRIYRNGRLILTGDKKQAFWFVGLWIKNGGRVVELQAVEPKQALNPTIYTQPYDHNPTIYTVERRVVLK